MLTSLKRIFAAAASTALVASAFAFGGGSAHAQSRTSTNVPGKWASAILIQNTGTASLAGGTYDITFYDTNGNIAKSFQPTDTIAAGASKEFYIPSAVSDLASGQYSAVISSSQRVKAVVNSSTDSGTAPPWSAFSYEGVDAESAKPKIFFPAFYKTYFGFLSELVVQNTGTAAATVQATFYNGKTGAKTGPIDLGSIPASAAKTFSYNDSAFAALAGSSLYGVVIESTNSQPLAGVSNFWTADAIDAGVGSYNAVTSGAQTVYAAALYNQYYGFVSSITIQNLDGATAAAGTITYSDGTTDPFNIPANQSREFFQPAKSGLGSGPTNGLLSAKITATTGSVAAIVNIQRKQGGSISIADPSNPALGSYTAASVTGTTVNVPAIYSDYFGYFTAVSVQNTGAATTITLRYGDGKTWVKAAKAGETINFSHLPGAPGNPLAAKTVIGGTVTSSSNQPLVVIIQHNTDTKLTSYRPSKSPNDFLFVLSGFPN
jgi:hypothetical protein